MKKNGKRYLSLFLTLVMLLGIFPVQALAEEIGGADSYASDPADPSSGVPGQTLPGGSTDDDPDDKQDDIAGQDQGGTTPESTPSDQKTTPPVQDGILNPTGPVNTTNAPAPGSGSGDGNQDQPGDKTPGEEKPEDKVWKASIKSGRLELTFGKDEEYTLKSLNAVFPDNADIRARFWREDEENRYRSWIGELRGTEDRILALSMRDGKGDNEVYAFDTLVEFYLSCKDWEGKTLDEMNERQFALYLLNSDGELGTAQTLFQIMDGAPALFFSTNMLADLLLNEPTQEEKDRRKQAAEEEAARLAELAKQQEEEAKKNAESVDDKNDDENLDGNKNEQIGDNTSLENKEELKDEVKEEEKEEKKEEEKEELKEEIKEEAVVYLPQEQTLGNTKVSAQIPEGALNEYAQLTLTAFNDEMTDTIKTAILANVNAGVEEQPDETEQNEEQAAGKDGQTSVAKKQEIASLILMDISFVAGDVNHTPDQPVILTIQDDAIKTMAAPRVFHYVSGQAEDLTGSATIDKEAGSVTFPAAAFSPYAVVGFAEKGAVEPAPDTEKEKEDKTITTEPDDTTIETYIPQSQSLNGVTVSIQIPEGALNEYALLTLNPANEEDTAGVILAQVNAGLEKEELNTEPADEALPENEVSEEEAETGLDATEATQKENEFTAFSSKEIAKKQPTETEGENEEQKTTADGDTDVEETAGVDGQTVAPKRQQIASMVLVDISFTVNEEPIYPSGAVEVTIQAEAIKTMKAPRLYHMISGKAEELTEGVTFDSEAGTVTFSTASFSPFAVVDLEDEGTVHPKKAQIKKAPANLLGAENDALPSGTYPANSPTLKWHVEENEVGDYVLIVEPNEGLTTAQIPSNFYNNIKSALGDYASQLKELSVTDGITAINNNSAFANAPFEKVTLAESVKSVGNNTFQNCSMLSMVSMPGVTSLGTRAFSGCTSLTSTAFLPASLTTVNTYVFENCTGLTSVDLSGTAITSVPNYMFSGCSKLKTVKFPGSVTTIGSNVFNNCTALESVDLSETKIITLTGSIFNGRSNLKAVKLPETLTTIGSSAFNSCSSLTSLDLSGLTNLKTIEGSAFNNCQTLQSIQLPDSLTTLGSYVFQNCTSLQELDLENTSLTSLPYYMISGANQIKTITAPSTVTTLSTYAFNSAGSLKNVDLSKTQLTTLANYSFNNCKVLEEVILPESMTDLGSSAFSGCPAAVNLTVYSKNMTTPASGLPSGLKNVTVKNTVDTLDGTMINKAVSNGGKISFEGPNDLAVSKASGNVVAYGTDSNGNSVYSTGESDNKPLTQLDGKYYVDVQGVLYQLNDDGTAELVYVPTGVTSLTVPEKITSVAGEEYTVTKVGGYAFAEADDLTAVTFEKPAQVTIPPKTFTGSKVATVNGKDKIKPSDFAEVSQLCDFPLEEDQGNVKPQVVVQIGTEDVINPFKIISVTPDEEDGVYRLKTGETAMLNIGVSNPDNEMMKDAIIRIYIQTTGTGFSLGNYSDPSRDDYSVQDQGNSWPLKVKQGDTPGLYYYEISGLTPGDSFIVNNGYSFPSISSAGGTMLMWAEFVSKDQATETLIQEDGTEIPNPNYKAPDTIPTGDYLKAEWTTRQENFQQYKYNYSNPTLYGSGTADERVYVNSMGYKLTENNSGSSSVGADYAVFMEYDDVLKPPQGIILTPAVKEAIEKGRIRYAYESSYNTYAGKYHYYMLSFYAKLENGTEKRIAYAYTSSSGYQFRDGEAEPQLTIDDENKLHIHFKTASPYLKYNYTGECYGSSQYPATDLYVYYDSAVYEVDRSVTYPGTNNPVALFEENGDLKKNVGRFRNEVDNIQDFSWGPDKGPIHAQVDSNLMQLNGQLNLTKVRTSSWSAYMGGPVNYEIRLNNSSVVTSHVMEKGYLEDLLPVDVYLRPTNIENLFKNAPARSTLRLVRIVGATLCKPVSETVTQTNGSTTSTGIVPAQHSSGEGTHYEGLWGDQSGEVDSSLQATDKTLTIIKENGQYSIYRGSDMDTLVATAGMGGLEAALNNLGLVITQNTRYRLIWDLADNFAVYAGQTITFPIQTHLKDSFMLLQRDVLGYYGSSGYYAARNTVNGYRWDGTQGKHVSWKNADSDTTYIYRDYSLSKSAKVSNTSMASKGFKARENDIIDYSVIVSRSGGETWPTPLPLTDKVQGAQVVLAPVSGNANATLNGVKLSEAGLKTYTTGGASYYMLNKEGTYKGVLLGGQISDSITVEKTSAGQTTFIRWYFSNNGSAASPYVNGRTLSYKALLSAAETGIEAESGKEYPVVNETWLNDHETHRLYAAIEGDIIIFRFRKYIVEKQDPDYTQVKDPESLVDFSNIHEGEEIVYKIPIKNEGNLTATLRGSQIYDALPKTAKTFAWNADMVTDISYQIKEASTVPEGESSFCTTTGREYWYVDSHLKTPTNDTDTAAEGQYYIHWKDNFAAILVPQAELWIYVTLKFPSGDEWNSYVSANKGGTLYNDFYLDNIRTRVDHNLAAKGRAVLEKGVFQTAFFTSNTSYTDRNDRQTYPNGPLMDFVSGAQNAGVQYYVVLYNGSDSRLYLDTLEDHLPKGFLFRGMNSNSNSGDSYGNPSRWYGNTILYNTERNNYGSRVASVTDPGRNVTYVGAEVSVQERFVVNGCQTVKFTLKRPTSYTTSNMLRYDSDEGKHYLAPGEAVRFAYNCIVGTYLQTGNVAADNSIAMPFYDYLHTGLEDNQTEVDKLVHMINVVTPSGTARNDGGCEVLSKDEAAAIGYIKEGLDQWLKSDVRLTPSPVRPGIQKTVGGTSAPVTQGVTDRTIQGSTDGTFGTKYNGFTIGEDIVNWRVNLYNEEDKEKNSDLYEYTVTDTVQADYAFCGEVFLKMNGTTRTLFRLGGNRTINDTEIPIQIVSSSPGGWTSSPSTWTKIKVNGPEITGGGGSYKYYTVQLKRDAETGYESLIIKFLNPLYAIRPGVVAELGLHTQFGSGKYELSRSFLNNAVIHTDIPYDYEFPSQGYPVRNSSGEALEGKESGVESSAAVNMINGFAATAVKKVTELGNVSNTATSDDEGKNTITMPEKNTGFRYDLQVTTPDSQGAPPIKKIVICDNLPEPGDKAPNDSRLDRNSSFKVSLMDDPSFALSVLRGGDKQPVVFDRTAYSVQLSTKNVFDEFDWAGAGSGWVELTDVNAQKEVIRSARSIRVIIEDESGEDEADLFPRGSVIQASFNARIDDPENKAKPGDIAWNSFVYNYTIMITPTRPINLMAAPLVVGVKVPEVPRLQKRLVDESGATMTAPKDLTFEFLIYSGNPIPELNSAEKMKMKDIAELLTGRDVYYVPLLVKEGQSSVSQKLGDGKCWAFQNGKWMETDKNWTWTHNNNYAILETHQGVRTFQLKTLKDSKNNNVSFTQNGRNAISLVAVNEHREVAFGELKIVKSIDKYEASEPATFVFRVDAVKDGETVYSNYALITFDHAGTLSTLLSGIPVGAEVTVTEVYSGARYKSLTREPQTETILSLDNPDAPATVTFENTYGGKGPGGHGIQNSFETKVNPSKPDEYNWADWEKPDMNNP